ncbi:helicase-related protein [Micromonospora sp. NPDC051196]|uniref:DEAD/DEAH box helicase n=1 Tax=Micromonospora sp. NPDC051196 TaxID=3155281 RepID=UPI003430F5E0
MQAPGDSGRQIFPNPAVLAGTHGYHPLATDATAMLATGLFTDVLALGADLPDPPATVKRVRQIVAPPVSLPEGIYWFGGLDPAPLLVVTSGAMPGVGMRQPAAEVADDSPVASALGWFDHLWEDACEVPLPLFAVTDEVITRAGQDGMIKSRQFAHGRWIYQVFAGSRIQRIDEEALSPKPTVDSPDAWVRTAPAPAERLAATLTRAKLEKQFTDTVFSFRATRTIFRPYQFKPVMKLLSTGSLRLLIADEVGLGKTIEAGLLWTELDARRHANRVLVVCPSALLTKWQHEMRERFGFELTELTGAGLADLKDRLESDRLPRRMAWICSVERLRAWKGLADIERLDLQLDLVIVDEAHVFRNTGTKSHALGELLSRWADAYVFLSATPVNLRNNDLYNLLELLVPGEFQDLADLQDRIEPNKVLNRITGSLLDTSVSNTTRRRWLSELSGSAFGRVITMRPEFVLLGGILEQPHLSPTDVVQVKRICSELGGLSAQVTRTRKIEVQENKSVREPRPVHVRWTQREHDFYQAYLQWCVERARVKDTPLHFGMQMPLRLAGSCLPEAAALVLTSWNTAAVQDEVNTAAKPAVAVRGPDVPPSRRLRDLAAGIDVDTKLERLLDVVDGLVRQGKQGLVFTFSRRTLSYLERHLRGRCRAAVLHGGVGRDDRARIMADFRAGGYDIVVATKVASEGLDFEFCSVLVNYDLPWNPMEIEQRIGRIDRIGQSEQKIVIINFTTPGTIESDILERVIARIGIFEHAIGALEPIVESVWPDVESCLLDFTLTPAQRKQRTQEFMAVIAEQKRAAHEVESAAPHLISSDGVDIEGLEPDLLASGRYVGQQELALLVSDWVESYGGRCRIRGDHVTVSGNSELAGHVRDLTRRGDKTRSEVDRILSDLTQQQPIQLSLDQEASRTSGVPLLTANHPLVRAALNVPGHRQTRFSAITMSAQEAGTAPGTYLVHLCIATWNGIRPLHEVWTVTVDARTLQVAPDLGDRLMAAVAAGNLKPAWFDGSVDLQPALEMTSDQVVRRHLHSQDRLAAENAAFLASRRLSIEQVHQRRIQALESRIATLRARGRDRVVPLFQAQQQREDNRYAGLLQDITARSTAMLSTEDLAVCVVEVQ